MIDIKSLILLCETALASGTKELETKSKKKLTKEEKELLVAASNIGEFYILSADQISDAWVKAGSKHFLDEKDPAYTATYFKAFISLCERGYIIHDHNKLFILNDSGFKKARELARN